jgi:hypothetical protein
MYTRHLEIDTLATRPGRKVEAIYYNHVQSALKKLELPEVRFRLMKHLDLIVQKDAWIVVDRVLNDIPVVGWMNFDVAHRESLHEPVTCEIRFWHVAATMILKQTLEILDKMLDLELAELEQDDEGVRILKFPGAND